MENGQVITIGNFDGVHLGHHGVIAQARAVADAENLPLTVLTFEPHPLEYFRPDLPPFRLTLQAMKEKLLVDAGADHVVSLPFDAALAEMDAASFVEDMLIGRLHAHHVVIGHDFAFGRGRAGNVDMLRQVLPVTELTPVLCGDGSAYSSTRIRALLRQGDFSAAEKLLGHPWVLEAPVIHGDKRGRTLGYPTANQKIGRYVQIPYGIYAVEVKVPGEDAFRPAVASFGIRPMFAVESALFETFIFDYEGDLYDRPLAVRPRRFLRPEMKFDTLDALLLQMKEDCHRARQILI